MGSKAPCTQSNRASEVRCRRTKHNRRCSTAPVKASREACGQCPAPADTSRPWGLQQLHSFCQTRTLTLPANPSFSSSIGRETLIGLHFSLEIQRRTPHLIRPLVYSAVLPNQCSAGGDYVIRQVTENTGGLLYNNLARNPVLPTWHARRIECHPTPLIFLA